MCMMRGFRILVRTGLLALATGAGLGFCFGHDARAGDLVLDIASDVGANVEFKGTGTGTNFSFNNNGAGNGFDVTASSGVGDSVGLHGRIGGMYSYTNASIVTMGILQSAPVSTSGGTLTITDASMKSLTGTITGVDISTLGTDGAINVSGSINLTNVSYGGTNADLTELRNEANFSGGVVAISFQFAPGRSLTQLAASGSDRHTSYSGSIVTAAPEPSGLALGCIAIGTIGLGWRWRRTRGA
jgi:hypothetical protein